MICTLCLENELNYINTNPSKIKNNFIFNLCHFATFNNHPECLEYAHQNGLDLDINICIISIINGHVECLKYAHQNGGEMFVYACELAARFGRLECMKYILDNGGSVDNSCYWAAKYGHLNCLIFAHKNNGTLQDSCDDEKKFLEAPYKVALKKGHRECFEYAFKNLHLNMQIFKK